MRNAIAVLLLLTLAVPCFSGTVPSATAQVSLSSGVKQYIYTLTNDLDSGQPIEQFAIYMPADGGRMVTSAAVSRLNWLVDGGYMPRYGCYGWGTGALASGHLVMPGESLTLTLTTLASVPTLDVYVSPFGPTNWAWLQPNTGFLWGNSTLPVPAPEPSALLALAGGLGAFGLPMLRGRKWAASFRHRDPLV